MTSPLNLLSSDRRVTAHAVLIGDRIDTTGLEHGDALSTAPLAFRTGGGIATLFRYGVVVLTGVSAAEEAEMLRELRSRVRGEFQQREEETAPIELSEERDEQVPPGGPIYLKVLTLERVLVISDALAKSVVLARDEREVASVFDTIEPFARELAERGRTPGGRRAMLKHIGNASPLPKSPMCCGTARISSVCTLGWKPNTSSRNAPRPSVANWPSSRRPRRHSPTSSIPSAHCV